MQGGSFEAFRKMNGIKDMISQATHNQEKGLVRFLPVGIDVRGKTVLFFGGGKVALQKLRTILMFGPKVTVVAPEILPEIKALGVECIEDNYGQGRLSGAFLVYACTSDRDANRAIAGDAHDQGILCNVADDTQACVFISPAVAFVDDLVIAVDSQGRNPKLSRAARDFIKGSIHEFLHGRT